MIKIRYGVYETNSSSTHSITIATKDEFQRFEDGELILCNHNHKLVEKKKVCKCPEQNEYECECLENYSTYSQFCNHEHLETFEESHTTKSGDEIVVFGKYGYDG